MSEAGDGVSLPTADDVRFFRDHGWWVSPPIVPASLIEDSRNGVARFERGERDEVLPPLSALLDWRPEHGDGTRQYGYVSLQVAEVRRLVRWPSIAASAAALLGVTGIRLFHDRVVIKPAARGNATALGWHTDRAYWRTCSSTAMLTAWIPLVPIAEDMGGLMVIDHSHAWAGTDDMATAHVPELTGQELAMAAAGRAVDKVMLRVPLGHVSFHHCRTVHGSGPNVGTAPRIALSVHLQEAGNSYRPFIAEDGRRVNHLNDALCRLDADDDPDYGDPLLFPVLWEERPHAGTG